MGAIFGMQLMGGWLVGTPEQTSKKHMPQTPEPNQKQHARRLLIFIGPPAAVLCGVALGALFDWAVAPVFGGVPAPAPAPTATAAKTKPTAKSTAKSADNAQAKTKGKAKVKVTAKAKEPVASTSAEPAQASAQDDADDFMLSLSQMPLMFRVGLLAVAAVFLYPASISFYESCDNMARSATIWFFG
jgi:hypothetical protein